MKKLIWDFIDVIVRLIFMLLAIMSIVAKDYEMATFWIVLFLLMMQLDEFSSQMKSMGEGDAD